MCGSIFDVRGNHPPHTYIGSYQTSSRGGYDGTALLPNKQVSISGFATLLFAVEFSNWGNSLELSIYLRDLNPRASRAINGQAGKIAKRLGGRFSVMTNKQGIPVILNSDGKQIAQADVDSVLDKLLERELRTIIIQSDLAKSEVQPLVTKLESRGFIVRVESQAVFR